MLNCGGKGMPSKQKLNLISDLKGNSGNSNIPSRPQLSCTTCLFKSRCLPATLEGKELLRFERLIQHLHRPLRAGQLLVRQGDAMEALFALRVGSLKAIINLSDGSEHIMGFRFPGTVIGTAEPEQMKWSRTFVALEDTWLCRIPLSALNSVRTQLIKLMSERLRIEYYSHLTLAYKHGDRKLAAFLLDISDTFRKRGLSPQRFYLPMSYIDIANFLCMRHESVSRTMTILQKNGLVEKQNKMIRIPNLEALRYVVET